MTVEKTPLAAKSSPGGTPYANSRIRAARQRLLSIDEMREYLNERSFENYLRRLSESEYEDALVKALVTQKGITAVNTALISDLRTTYQWVFTLSEKKYRKLLTALVAKWDVTDLKTIIRAKASGTPLSDENVIFSGIGVQVSPEAMAALARQETLEDVVNLALTWDLPYSKAFVDGLEAYYLDERIAEFELKIDQAYVAWATKQFRGLGEGAKFARKVFGQEIDKLNINTLIRLSETTDEVEEPMSYFLQGGLLVTGRRFEELVDIDDLYELVETLGIKEYERSMRQGYENYLLTGHLSEIERALEVQLTRMTIKEGYRDILGFGVALSYLTAKENETTNMGIIAHGVYRAIAPAIIEKDLILV